MTLPEIAARVRAEEACFVKIQNLAGVGRDRAMEIFRQSKCDAALSMEKAGKIGRGELVCVYERQQEGGKKGGKNRWARAPKRARSVRVGR